MCVKYYMFEIYHSGDVSQRRTSYVEMLQRDANHLLSAMEENCNYDICCRKTPAGGG